MPASLARLCRLVYDAIRGDTVPLPEAQLSQIISFARISLIVGLVFIHYEAYPNAVISPVWGLDPERNQVATFIQSFVLLFFYSVVPLLSAISGWLFFSFKTDPMAALGSRIQRRFSSLYLPLVFWNALFLGILLLLFLLRPGYPLLQQIRLDFNSAGAMDYVNALFGVTSHPVAFQFWFVRDLFVTALVSPVLWLLLNRAPLLGAVILGGSWIAGFDLWIFFRTDVAFFFFLGGIVRTRSLPVEISARSTLIFLGAYVVLVSLRTLAPYVVDGNPGMLQMATSGMRVVGVLACWGVIQRIALTQVGAMAARYGGLAFFLHAAHYPLLAEVKIVLWQYLPAESQFWMVAHYLVSVAVTTAIGIGLGLLLTRVAPRSFALMNGGRALA